MIPAPQPYGTPPSNIGTVELKDYFAAKAMQSLLTHHELCMTDKLEKVAEVAYQYADAMIEARKK